VAHGRSERQRVIFVLIGGHEGHDTSARRAIGYNAKCLDSVEGGATCMARAHE
jgi:hypothetical protein